MGFKIKVNGEVVHEIDEEVERISSVSLRSGQGEAGNIGLLPGEDAVDLVFTLDSEEVTHVQEARLRREKNERIAAETKKASAKKASTKK